MICVSIGRGRHRHVLAEHKHMVEQGAKLVELRIDYIRSTIDIKRLLNHRPCPVIITCRREREGGKFTGTEEARRMLLRSAIASGADYVDLEEDIAGSIPRYGKTKRIISLHDFMRTPDDLASIHARLAALDADIIKITTLANRPHDNVRMLRLVKDAKIPTVGFCMGDMGTPSRILAGKFGSPLTYATFHHERALAPGQLSFDQMMSIYHYPLIDRHTEVYGVIGDPIGHSLSPLIHNAAFRAQNLNKVYIPFRVPREDLSSFLDDCPELGIAGLSVTIPHKEAVYQSLSRSDEATKTIEAANTLIFNGRERVGSNTDYQAAIASLKKSAGALRNLSAMVLGAGGAALAVAYGLRQEGARVTISARTNARADKLAAHLKCRSVDWEQRHAFSCDVLVNCTPVGMHPNVTESPYDKHKLKPGMVVFDTVYNPETTLLVKEARSRSCTVVTGVDMFIGQASMQYKLFTGQDAPEDLMRDTLKRAIGSAKN